MSFLIADVKRLHCCQKLNAASLSIYSNNTKRRRFESSFMGLMSTSGVSFTVENRYYCVTDPVRRDTVHPSVFVVWPAPSSSSSTTFITLFLVLLSSIRPAWKSQSWDFDDVGSSWACCGLDARGCWAAWRQGHPSLQGAVEAIAVRGQSGRRREADDSRGEAAAFTVDPFAVISFQVEVRTAVRKEEVKQTKWDEVINGPVDFTRLPCSRFKPNLLNHKIIF